MNVRLSSDTASCIIKCPWQSPADRVHNYASVYLQSSVLKRRRSRTSSRRESGCKLVASIWYHERDPSSGSYRKNLRKSCISEADLPGWDGPARLLAIDNAFDALIQAQYTWIAVSVSKKKSASSGIALFRFDKDAIVLWHVFPVKTAISDEIAVLRGPSVLCTTENGLRLIARRDNDTSIVPVQLNNDVHEDDQILISRSQSDIEAFVLTNRASERKKSIQLFAVHFKSSIRQISVQHETNEYALKIMKVFAQQRLLVLLAENGAVAGIDLQNGKVGWHLDAAKELKQCWSISIFQDWVLFATSPAGDLWHTTICNVGDRLGEVQSLKLLFSGSSSTASSQHRYIYAPWRKSLLQYSDVDGSCCFEQQIAPSTKQVDKAVRGESNLSQVTNNLEHRLSIGVERLMETSSRKEAMMRMLHHDSSLLMEATGNIPHAQSNKLFCSEISNLIVLPNRKASISNTPMVETQDRFLQSTRIAVAGQSVLLDGTRFLRLIRSSCGLDRSRQFIVVQVNVALLESSTATDENRPSIISLALNVQFDKCMATIWNVQEKQGLKSGDVVWLTAYAPIASLVTSNSISLSDMSIVVRADSSDGRSQPLGALSVAKAMSCKADLGDKQVAPWRSGRSLYDRKVCAIATGPSAHRLSRLTESSDTIGNVKVDTRQDLAYVTFSATSGVEIAMAIARMKSFVDDDVELRSSPGLSKTSMTSVDSALTALDEEVRHLRGVVSRRGSVGYEADQMKQILMKQLAADEAIGRLEEELLGA